MSEIFKGELQDYEGNTTYPHTEADIVFCTDGKTVQEKLNQAEEALDVLGSITGTTNSAETDDAAVLPTSKVTAALKGEIDQISSDLGGFEFSVTSDGIPVFKPAGADTVIPFSKADISVYGGVMSVPQTRTLFDLNVTNYMKLVLLYDSFSISGGSNGTLQIKNRESGVTLLHVGNTGSSQNSGTITKSTCDISTVDHIVGIFSNYSGNGTSGNFTRSVYCLILY